MKRLQFTTSIQAPASTVYGMMLGMPHKSTYEQWVALFNPTSTYEGNWDKGSKMLFIGTDEQGERGGIVSTVVEHIPHRLVSIQHIGLVKGEQEITTGPEVEAWANGVENYTFDEQHGTTTVRVEIDSVEEFTDYFNDTYPKALEKLKEICEQSL